MEMNIQDICKHLPHRYPFLLVDRVLELKPGEYINAYKNITFNEAIFQGHFPTEPVFPGVFIIEALAQCSALLGFKSLGVELHSGMECYLTGVDNFKFRKPVFPGDQLHLQAKVKQTRRNIGSFIVCATVNDNVCCEGIVTCLYRTKST